jgi:hypothetical protein
MTREIIDRLLLGNLERCGSGRHARVLATAIAVQFRAAAFFALILYLVADISTARWRAGRRMGIQV